VVEHFPGALPLLQGQDTATATCTGGKQEAIALSGDAPGPEAGKEQWDEQQQEGTHEWGSATEQQPAFMLHPCLTAAGTGLRLRASL